MTTSNRLIISSRRPPPLQFLIEYTEAPMRVKKPTVPIKTLGDAGKRLKNALSHLTLSEKRVTFGGGALLLLGFVIFLLNLTSANGTEGATLLNLENTANGKKNRRKFVSYTSSEWEQLWLDNVDEWQEKKEICQVLLNDQLSYVREFISSMCTSRYRKPYESWCLLDDTIYPLWYDTNSTEQGFKRSKLRWKKSPLPMRNATMDGPARPVIPGPEHERVMSKFVFLDEVTGKEYVEYIEPLVSHLRFPLAKCLKGTYKQLVGASSVSSSYL
jgi:hypothetical protein